MKKLAPVALAVLLVVGLVVGQALAAPLGHQATVTASSALSGGTALVNSSSGKRIVVESMVVRASSAGVVTISDGTGGTALGKFYLAQDTPLILDEDLFGAEGLRTTAGNALAASGTDGVTVTALMRIRYE
jgi:hypothetical protein